MKPDIKAKELYNMFWDLLFSDIDVRYAYAIKCTKDCAISLCQEIINNNTHIAVISHYSNDLICSTQYWKKVIEHLKNKEL